jgi:hypothetical protein
MFCLVFNYFLGVSDSSFSLQPYNSKFMLTWRHGNISFLGAAISTSSEVLSFAPIFPTVYALLNYYYYFFKLHDYFLLCFVWLLTPNHYHRSQLVDFRIAGNWILLIMLEMDSTYLVLRVFCFCF